MRLFAIGIVIICTPLSLLLLWLWCIFAGSVALTGEVQSTFSAVYKALVVEPNFLLAVHIVRQLMGTFGGFVGWISLFSFTAFMAVSVRPWSRIPQWIKIGCLVGVVSALALPAALGLALPPVLLFFAMYWLAVKREA